MVYYKDTLELCHPPTELGRELYRAFLEREADDILFRTDHPVLWLV